MNISLYPSISDMTDDTIYKEDNNDDRFRILKNMFILIGTPLFPVRRARFYSVYRILVYFSLYFTFSTIIIGIVKNFGDMGYVTESGRPGLSMFNVLWTHFFMSINLSGLQNLVRMATSFTWSELPTRDPVSGSRTVAGWIARTQVLAWRVANVVFASHVLYLVLRIVTKSPNPLFFNAWFPFDSDNIVGYTVVLVFQGFGSIVLAYLLFGFMCLYAVLVGVGCTQLEKVQISLMELKQLDDEPHSELHRRFVLCLKHHQQVLRYIRTLEDTFHLMLLGPFLSVAATLCFAAFTALTISGNHVESVQILLVIFAFMCQIQSFCWFGNELTQQVLNETYTYLMFLMNFLERSSRDDHKA